ncbi:hypothetical protein JOL62DRAFT_578255 [Phyllosticta paracitricarpa]|uniref:Secreted protein n=1 Tax=Phyllosticta paracitricarpa TaxID=2016321 RepID=A0ABR1N5S3_9PEZI
MLLRLLFFFFFFSFFASITSSTYLTCSRTEKAWFVVALHSHTMHLSRCVQGANGRGEKTSHLPVSPVCLSVYPSVCPLSRHLLFLRSSSFSSFSSFLFRSVPT